jgi:hypothetical protein
MFCPDENDSCAVGWNESADRTTAATSAMPSLDVRGRVCFMSKLGNRSA